MAKINILDSIIFNRIAAGEVVESPASVVKELIENSIDAGAKSITVEIKGGGIDYIRVTDNGKGIDAEDIPVAFLPHATSKIKTLNDLEKIGTLGFRGEALPSIASVARVSLTSKTINSELGHCVVFENGALILESPIGAPNGTTVTVENLFDKVPARKKFLKKPALEGAKITELMQKLILANYFVEFKYINNDNIVYHSSGRSIDDAIYTIYGDTVKNLEFIESTMPDITLKGYVNKPTFSRHNKSFQVLIVNGRVVENEDISYYIYICFQDYLMRRQYPMFVLYLDLPLDMVDVNVHPNKMNVKFSDLPQIKGIVMSAVKASIAGELNIPKNIELKDKSKIVLTDDIFDDNQSDNAGNKINDYQNNSEYNYVRDIKSGTNSNNYKDNTPDGVIKDSNSNLNDSFKASGNLNNEIQINPSKSSASGARITSDFLNGNQKHNNSVFNNKSGLKQDNVLRESAAPHGNNNFNNGNPFFKMENIFSKKAVESEQCEIQKENDYVICGKLFNTYILIQENCNIYLVDQHAAHEKILYDRLIEDVDAKKMAVQNLLIPFIFEVSATEKHLLIEKMNELNSLGFGLTEFGINIFALHSVPILCMDINLKEFTEYLIESLKNGRIKKSDFIKEAVMQSACKSAVKAHDDLSKDEVSILINDMLKNGGALFCPHGRPIVIKLTKTEIEKWFKRIV